MAKLARLGHRYDTPLALHTDIMAVLTGLAGGSAQDVIIAVLEAGLDDETNAPLENIRKFGSIEAFWQMVQGITGFVQDEEKTLADLAAHVLLSALAQTMNAGALRGLERYVAESRAVFCYEIVAEWRTHEETGMLYEIAREVEAQLGLAARFEKMETETLLTSDIFPAIDEAILSRFYAEIADNVLKLEFVATDGDDAAHLWLVRALCGVLCMFAGDWRDAAVLSGQRSGLSYCRARESVAALHRIGV